AFRPPPQPRRPGPAAAPHRRVTGRRRRLVSESRLAEIARCHCPGMRTAFPASANSVGRSLDYGRPRLRENSGGFTPKAHVRMRNRLPLFWDRLLFSQDLLRKKRSCRLCGQEFVRLDGEVCSMRLFPVGLASIWSTKKDQRRASGGLRARLAVEALEA